MDTPLAERVVVTVPKKDVDYWEVLMARSDVDFGAEGLNEYATAWRKTVRFMDGCEMDIRVCTDAREDHTLWSEAVLFGKHGYQIACTDVCDRVAGDWTLSCTGDDGVAHEYTVTVVAE